MENDYLPKYKEEFNKINKFIVTLYDDKGNMDAIEKVYENKKPVEEDLNTSEVIELPGERLIQDKIIPEVEQKFNVNIMPERNGNIIKLDITGPMMDMIDAINFITELSNEYKDSVKLTKDYTDNKDLERGTKQVICTFEII